ncbi:hypothetical protein TWF281_000421 [Arthrobotrys megalospora]
MNRRVTFNVDDEETVSNAPIPPPARSKTAPPTYIKYTPGGRLEFLKDIEAYQAACLINKVVDSPINDPAPAYTLHDFGNPNSPEPSGDKEVFRARFQEKLTKLKESMQHRGKGVLTKKALSEKASLLICGVILVVLAGLMAAWVLLLHHVGFLIFLGILWVATLLKFFYTGWGYYHKRRMLRAINVALEKVDMFEKLDDKTVQAIKTGVEHAVPRNYWADAAAALKVNRTSVY